MVKKKLIIKGSATPPKAVGPGNPPEHTRFKPGQSGNPKGRPKGSKNLATALGHELMRMVTITVDGKLKQMRKLEVVAHRLINDSMKGDLKAMALLVQLTNEINDQDATADGALPEATLPSIETLRRIATRLNKIANEGDQ